MTTYLTFPKFDPIVFSIGSLSLHWYGLMYLFGLMGAFLLANYRISKKQTVITKKQLENLLFWGFIGLFLGGRLGYVFFYNFEAFMQRPFILLEVWNGGMSFHGGLIGALIVMLIFAHYYRYPFFLVSDFIAPLIPIGLMFGRLGNFINGELWGRVTYSALGMLFPTSRAEDAQYVVDHPNYLSLYEQNNGILPRYPSQLAELFFEGFILFIILNFFIRKARPMASVSGLFLFFYGIFRFIIEYIRQPDEQLGLFFNFISMGQILSLPMILFGFFIFIYAYKNMKEL